jgi:hypothetical protein
MENGQWKMENESLRSIKFESMKEKVGNNGK